MIEYRERLYEKYGSRFQDNQVTFNVVAAERWGRAYDYYFRNWRPAAQSAEIVDLACGGGRLLHFFKRRGYQNIRGVDISAEQVESARQVTPQVERADALSFLEMHPNTFDLITGLDIVEHFQKDEVLRFLDGCFSALKPQGRVILQTPNADSPYGLTHRYNCFTHEVCFNPNLATRLLALCGFQQIEARESGPVPLGYSVKSSLRYPIWQAIRAGFCIWNLAETGEKGSGVWTRVFLISGIKG